MKTTIATLAIGQVLLATARNVAGGKVQLEFAEIIDNPAQSTNVLAAMNADDDRFKATKKGARRVFLTASPAMAMQHFGVDAKKLTDEPSEINLLNPTLGGKRLRIQVTESFKGTEYEMANPEKTAKQYKDNEGNVKYFVKEGKLIFSSTKLVDVEPKHTIISSDKQVSWEEYSAAKVEDAVANVLNQDALN